MDPLIEALGQAVLSEMDKPFVSSNANAMTAMTRSPGHGHLRPLQPLLAVEFLVAIRRCSTGGMEAARAIWQNCCRQICRVGQRSIVQRSTRTTRASPAVRMR